jgi:hypothetical protein
MLTRSQKRVLHPVSQRVSARVRQPALAFMARRDQSGQSFIGERSTTTTGLSQGPKRVSFRDDDFTRTDALNPTPSSLASSTTGLGPRQAISYLHPTPNHAARLQQGTQSHKLPATYPIKRSLPNLQSCTLRTFIAPTHPANANMPTFDDDLEWTRKLFRQLERDYLGMTAAEILSSQPNNNAPQSVFAKLCPKLCPKLCSLNLNTDGSDLTYTKSRAGPNAD